MQNVSERIAEIKDRIKKIDILLDSDISDELFDSLEAEAITLTEELGRLESLNSIYNAKSLTVWTIGFPTFFIVLRQERKSSRTNKLSASKRLAAAFRLFLKIIIMIVQDRIIELDSVIWLLQKYNGGLTAFFIRNGDNISYTLPNI